MLLEMKGITKKYGDLVANDNINLSLNKGEILAICGENGAGKSTIMKILYGLESATSGEIYLNGELVNFKSPQNSIEKGIGMVQQHFMLFAPFTAAENIVYGKEPKKNGVFFDKKAARKTVLELCEKYGLDIDPDAKVGECSVGMQQRIEILKVLYQDADIIIFDEPSAVLTPQEVSELLITIKNLADMGKSIIIITHKLHEIMQVADRVFIMRGGKYIKDMKKEDTSIEEMSYLMVGRHLVGGEIPPQETGEVVLDIDNLVLTGENKKPILDNFSMQVREGEIVGIAGVSGNGQSELIQCITGLLPYNSGDIKVAGNDIKGKTVMEIRQVGCACIPEDRYLWGCAKKATLSETALMAKQRSERFSSRGVLKNKQINSETKSLLDSYNVSYSGVSQRAEELSGGNLQKVIVAREIEHNAKLLISAEPTRGVDIGAMEYIHSKLLEKRAAGDAVLLISSELSEIMSLSDRVYVIYDGKVAGMFNKDQLDSEKLGLLMMGGHLDD